MPVQYRSRRGVIGVFPSMPTTHRHSQQRLQPRCGLVNKRWNCELGIQHQKQCRGCFGSVMLTLSFHVLVKQSSKPLVVPWEQFFGCFFFFGLFCLSLNHCRFFGVSCLSKKFHQRPEFFGRHSDITREGSHYSHATFMAGISVWK